MRSVVKALSWRAFAAVDTAVAATVVMFIKTGHINSSSIIGLVGGIVGMELITKTFLFAMHERLWEGRTAKVVAAPTAEAVTESPSWEQVTERMRRDYRASRLQEAID